MDVVSISFPDMIKHHSVQVVTGHEATSQNLTSLLHSDKDTFKCDPVYGVHLQRYTFDQNDVVLQYLLRDEIYKQIRYFMPQLDVKREDIKFKQERGRLIITIEAINKIDGEVNSYELTLFEED